MPADQPIDWLINNTPLNKPMFLWARLWGVHREFEIASSGRQAVTRMLRSARQKLVPARIAPQPIADDLMPPKNLTLRPLAVSDEHAFRAAVEEFSAVETEMKFAFCFDPSMDFVEYVDRVNSWPHGEKLTVSFVPNTFLVAVVEHAIVGRVSIRHELNDFLSKYGGHIGYCVTPSHRRQGYASEMLRLSLPIAAHLGLSRVLVTCDEDNIASRRIIEKNGGVFAGTAQEPNARIPKRKYWIEVPNHTG